MTREQFLTELEGRGVAFRCLGSGKTNSAAKYDNIFHYALLGAQITSIILQVYVGPKGESDGIEIFYPNDTNNVDDDLSRICGAEKVDVIG